MNHTIDPIWERIHKNQAWGGYPTEHVIRFVARNYYPLERSKIKILDFGCGQGAHTWYLAREGFDTYAFDGSESAVLKAENKLCTENLSAAFKVMQGIQKGYENCFFDAVIDSACIYANQIDDIKIMYSNVYEWLKGGGKFLTISFGQEMSGYRTGQEIEYNTFINITEGVLKERGVTHIFTEDEIRQILGVVGFRNIVINWCKYLDHGHMVHQLITEAEK